MLISYVLYATKCSNKNTYVHVQRKCVHYDYTCTVYAYVVHVPGYASLHTCLRSACKRHLKDYDNDEGVQTD